METLRCPTCLSVLLEAGQRRCPVCRSRLRTSDDAPLEPERPRRAPPPAPHVGPAEAAPAPAPPKIGPERAAPRPFPTSRRRKRRDERAAQRIDTALARLAPRELVRREAEESGRATARAELARRDAAREPSRADRHRRRRQAVTAGSALVVCVAIVVVSVAAMRNPHKAATAPSGSTAPASASALKQGTPLLDESFDGPALDTKRWATCYWWATDGCDNGTSGELEWYRRANVRTVDGALELQARKQTITDDAGKQHPYTSGMVSGASPTGNLFTFEYGYVEARAWIPQGTGLWSAFWLLPANRASLPEVDVFETVGERPDDADAHLHWKTTAGEQQIGKRLTTPGLTSDWHTVGVDWEPGSLTWYVDGTKRWTVTDRTAVPSQPMYLLADLAVGGSYTRPPNSATPFPSTLKFDYIRVWRRR